MQGYLYTVSGVSAVNRRTCAKHPSSRDSAAAVQELCRYARMHVGMQTGINVTSATFGSKRCHAHAILLYMRWGAGLQKLFDKAPETLNPQNPKPETLNSYITSNLKHKIPKPLNPKPETPNPQTPKSQSHKKQKTPKPLTPKPQTPKSSTHRRPPLIKSPKRYVEFRYLG